jgi:hypothetical protein
MRTLMRRTVATGGPMFSLLKLLLTFSTSDPLDGVHPLQSGMFRLLHPSERRPGLPRESSMVFWPRFVWNTLRRNTLMAGNIAWLLFWGFVVKRSSKAKDYTDVALTPARDDEDETLELFTKTAGARAAVAHVKKIAELTHAHPAA